MFKLLNECTLLTWACDKLVEIFAHNILTKFYIFVFNLNEMKKLLFSVLIVAPLCLSAQITITKNNMPMGGDILAQENANYVGTFDEGDTGPNHVWNFDETNLTLTGNIQQTECVDISSTPFTYQIFFNSPFDSEHNSDFAVGLASIGGSTQGLPVTLEDIYSYYQNNNSRYAIVGVGATVSGIPIPQQASPVDVVYDYPVAFGDLHTSVSEQVIQIPTLGYRKTNQTRVNEVDGWGTVNYFGTSYDVIRVKTTINAADSIYVDLLGFGFQFDRPETIEYKFLAQEFMVPLVQVNYTAGTNSGVLVASQPIGVIESSAPQLAVFPNPTTEYLTVQWKNANNVAYAIFNMEGKRVLEGSLSDNSQIEVNALANGLYFLKTASSETYFLKK